MLLINRKFFSWKIGCEFNLWHNDTKNKFKYITEKNRIFIPIIYQIIASKYFRNVQRKM